MLLPALMLPTLLHALVLWGSSTCPAPTEVHAKLALDRAEQHVELDRDGVLTLRDGHGDRVSTHRLTERSCELRTIEAAEVITGWVGLRRPVHVQSRIVEPPAELPQGGRHLELGLGASVTGLLEQGRVAFGASADFSMAPAAAGGLLAAGLDIAGPVQLVRAGGATSGSGTRASAAIGGGWRARTGPLAVDLLVRVPVTVTTVTQQPRLGPLEAKLEPNVSLGVQPVLRVSGWDGRFAPYVKVAVDVLLVSVGQGVVPAVSMSLAAGFAWSGS